MFSLINADVHHVQSRWSLLHSLFISALIFCNLDKPSFPNPLVLSNGLGSFNEVNMSLNMRSCIRDMKYFLHSRLNDALRFRFPGRWFTKLIAPATAQFPSFFFQQRRIFVSNIVCKKTRHKKTYLIFRSFLQYFHRTCHISECGEE